MAQIVIPITRTLCPVIRCDGAAVESACAGCGHLWSEMLEIDGVDLPVRVCGCDPVMVFSAATCVACRTMARRDAGARR